MLPSEMIILMAIIVNRNAGNKLRTRPMDVTGEYIGYLYNSLISRGYLKENRTRGYQLTPTGREAVFDFLKQNRNRSKDVVKRLQLLGIDISPAQEQRIDKLEKEAVKTR